MAMAMATATGQTAMVAATETGMPITAMEMAMEIAMEAMEMATAGSSRDELHKAVGSRT